MTSGDKGVTIACCAAVAILVAGCTTWRVQWVSPETVVRRDQPRAVEVTCMDSSRVVLDRPRIVGDSLIGENADGAAQSVALADVAYVAVRRSNGGGNASLVLLGAVAGFVALGLAVAATW